MLINQTSPSPEATDERSPSDTAATIAQSRRSLLGVAAACAGAAVVGSRGAAAAGNSAADQANDSDGVGTVWWVELVATDDVKSAAQYNSVLGWTSKRGALTDSSKQAQPDEPAYTLFMANGNEVAGAYRANPSDPVKNRPMWIVYFQVDNVDKAVGRAISQGGRILISPYDVPGSARMALLADMDGIPFGVAAPL